MIVYSDHKNLTYFRNAQKLNRRQVRWSLLLSEFDIKLIHIPGERMILSDALSRRPDFILDKDTDNEDMVLLPDKLFTQIPSPTPQQAPLFQRSSVSIHLIDLNLQRKIANSNDLDTEAIDAINLLLEKGPTNL